MNRYVDAEHIKICVVDALVDNDVPPWIIDCVVDVIDSERPADVVPVVHAHMVRAHSQGGGTHWVVCSNCEKSIDWQDTYCRHCGAIMDEEVDDD